MPGQDERPDLYTLLEPLVAERPDVNPWVLISPGGMQYFPDYELLEAMLGVPVGKASARSPVRSSCQSD